MKKLNKVKYFTTLILTLLITITYAQNNSRTFLFVGAYTDGKPDKGIFVYEFDTHTGQINKIANAENQVNPSYLSITPNGQYLYAANETGSGGAGTVSAFKIDTLSGRLTFLNKQSSGGRGPCYVTVHQSGKYVVAGNYSDAGIPVYACNEDGSLQAYAQYLALEGSSIIKGRQDKGHVHSVNFSPDGQYLYAPDLGADKIRAFKFIMAPSPQLIIEDELTINCVPGSGPRHFAFSPNGHYAYCIEELSGMISSYSYENGGLDVIGRDFSYSKEYEQYGAADIHVSPDGKFVYASNRLNDENTIAIFAINQADGTLSLAGHESTYGDHPRNFTLDPTGQFLLVGNKNTHTIVVFKRDFNTGLLEKTDTELQIQSPACLKMRTYGR